MAIVVKYTSNPGYVGPDSFSYAVSNQAGVSSNAAVANISVTAAPVVESPNNTNVPPSSSIIDASGAAWTLVASTASGNQIARNGVVNTITNNVVMLAYVNHQVWQNAYSLWWAWDGTAWQPTGGQSADPRPPPVPVVSNVSLSTNKNTALVIIPTLTAGTEITTTVLTQPAHGLVSLTDQNMTYVPVTGFAGSDSFTFKVTDASGQDSNVATASISVVVQAGNTINYMVGWKGNDSNSFATVKGWLGRPLDCASATIVTTGWYLGAAVVPNATVLTGVSFPMVSNWYNNDDTGNGTGFFDMAQAAAGAYNARYQSMVNALAGSTNPVGSIRIGWECTGNWYPWSDGAAVFGQPATSTVARFITVFKIISTMIHKAMPNCLVELNFNWSSGASNYGPHTNPTDYWPGKYNATTNPGGADIISCDFYQSNVGNGSSWATTQSGGYYDLDWMTDFAKAQGVLVACPECGPGKSSNTAGIPNGTAGANDGAWITGMIAWANSLGPLITFINFSDDEPVDDFITVGANPAEQTAMKTGWGKTGFGGTWWKGAATPSAGSGGGGTVGPVPVLTASSVTAIPGAETTIAPSLSTGTAASTTIVSVPSHGSVTLLGTSMVYKSSVGYTGPDSFSYKVTDSNGQVSNVAIVTMTMKVSTATIPTASTYDAGFDITRPAVAPAPKYLPAGGKGGTWTPVLNLTFGTAAGTGSSGDPTIKDIPTLGNYVVGCNNCGGRPTADQYGAYGSLAVIPASWNQLNKQIYWDSAISPYTYTPASGGYQTGEAYSLGSNYLRVTLAATVSGQVGWDQVSTGRFSPQLIPNPLTSGYDVLVETQFRMTGQPGQDIPWFWYAWWFAGEQYDLEIDCIETFAYNHAGGSNNQNSPCGAGPDGSGHSDGVVGSFGSQVTQSVTTDPGEAWPHGWDFSQFTTLQMILYHNGNWICTWNGQIMSAGTFYSSHPIGLIADQGWQGPSGRIPGGTETSARFPFFVDYTYLRYYYR